MLYREIIAVCSQIHTNTQCGQNVELLNVKPGDTYSKPLRSKDMVKQKNNQFYLCIGR